MSDQTVRELYESHVKRLSADERVRLIIMTARDLDGELATTELPPERNIVELHGLDKEVWQGIDAQQYVDELRNEWDQKD